MSIDNEIRKAFERHETDVETRPGAWKEVQRTIARGHRRRLAASVVGAALALTGVAVALPRLGGRHVISPVAPSGWKEFRPTTSGLRFVYPAGWSVTEPGPLGQVAIVPPGNLPKFAFRIDTSLMPGPFDTPLAEPRLEEKSGSIRGRRFNSHYSDILTSGCIARYCPTGETVYRIDWPIPIACRSVTSCPYTLVVTMSYASELRNRYGPTADQIVHTMTPASFAPSGTPSQPRVVGKISVAADRLADGSGSLWVVPSLYNPANNGNVLRVDPRTRKVIAIIAVGFQPIGIAADDTAVWVTQGCYDSTCRTPGLKKIDPQTNKVVASVRIDYPKAVALGFGSVWVTATNGSNGTALFRIDPATSRIVAHIVLTTTGGFGYAPVVTGGGFVWVGASLTPAGNSQDVRVYRIDPSTNAAQATATVPQGSTTGDIAADSQAVWVTTNADTSASGLAKLDPSTGRLVSRITLPDASPVGLNAVESGEGFVWAASARGYLWKVDPSGAHGDPLSIGDTPPVAASDVLTAFGSVWVANGDGHIWQLSP